MRPTRRFWTAVAVAGVIGVAALVFDRRFLLVSAGGVLAWLLAVQIAFVYAVVRFDNAVRIEQTLERTVTTVDEPVAVALSIDGPTLGIEVTARLRPVPGLETSGIQTATLDGQAIATVSTSIAGTHTLREPRLTIRDPVGLFVERYLQGPTVELRVEPREPSRIHVGEGGDALPVVFGEHAGGSAESGLVPAEIREYAGSESLARIDWKATARLSTPHVREYESESDLATIILFDQRTSSGGGTDGITALEYLQSAAIGYLAVAQSLGDPVGCYTVSNTGVRRVGAPSSSRADYERVRAELAGLTPEGEKRRRSNPPLASRGPSLDTSTTFGGTLAGYVRENQPVGDTDPLASAVQRATTAADGAVQIVLFTDDRDRASLKRAVSHARQSNTRLIAFLAPQVCFQRDALTDLPRAADRYREFEEFRIDLARTPDVEAYEIAPQDRLEAVLESVQKR